MRESFVNGASSSGDGDRPDGGADARPRWAAYVTPEGEEAELMRSAPPPASPRTGDDGEGTTAVAPEQRPAVEMDSWPSDTHGGAVNASASTINTEQTAEWPVYQDDAGGLRDDHDGTGGVRGDDPRAHHDEPRGAAIAPWRRPRFRDRPRGWWVLALAGQYASASASPARGGVAFSGAGVGSGAYVSTAQGAAGSRARTTRGLIAAGLALLLLGLALGRIFFQSSPAAAPSATPTVPAVAPAVFAPVTGPSLVAKRVLGARAGLAQPRAAAVLPDGRIVVADTANSRLVILDSGGRPLRDVHPSGGVLQQPFAVVAHGGSIYVLDAGRGAIERYTLDGRYAGDVIRGPALGSARGMAIGPEGRFYVANPLNNSIQIVAPDGTLAPAITSPLGAGPGQFNQPSDVAVGPDGIIYIMDSQNGRIEALTRGGAFVGQWAAPHADTLFSSRLLLLAGGRIMLSDPSGGLLLYAPAGGAPEREAITVAGQSQASPQPLGLALLPNGNILAVDGRGNQLLVVTPA